MKKIFDKPRRWLIKKLGGYDYDAKMDDYIVTKTLTEMVTATAVRIVHPNMLDIDRDYLTREVAYELADKLVDEGLIKISDISINEHESRIFATVKAVKFECERMGS